MAIYTCKRLLKNLIFLLCIALMLTSCDTNQEIDIFGNGNIINNNDNTPRTADNTLFGSTLINTDLDRVFEIRNTGASNLSLTGTPRVNITGPNAGNFSVITQPPVTLAPGTSAFFTVRFNRPTIGTSNASIVIRSNDSNEGTYTFSISATAGAPEIDLFGNNNAIANNDITPRTQDNTSFGSTSINTNLDQVFEIRNTGSAALSLTGTPRVALGGANAADFSIVAQPTATIAAGANATFTIRFNRATIGTSVATVTILSNDSNESTYSYSITANAVSIPEIDMYGNNILINDDDITPSTADNTSFGTVTINNNLDKIFEIRNTGAQALNLTGVPRVAISGANAANFTVLAQPGSTVAAGTSSFFTIRFSSAVVGVNNAIVTIISNDANEATYNFNITATATPVAPPMATRTTLYYQNFDNGANGWTSNTSAGSRWTLGRNGELGEGDYWYTDSYNNYIPNQRIVLTSPLIPTTNFTDLVFHLDYRIKSELGDDGMNIEYSLNGGLLWTTLGTSSTGSNWYNDNDVDAIANNANGWSGDNSALDISLSRFEEGTHSLPVLANNNPLMRFRITFAADNDTNVDDGAMVDNIFITGTEIIPTFATTGPANVNNNLTLWLDSKTIGQGNNTPLLNWNDKALNNNAFEIAAHAPIFTDNPTDNVNFNSTVTFNRAAQQHLRGKGGYNSNDYWIVVRSNLAVSNVAANETMLIGAKQAAVSPTKDPSGLGWGPVSARYTNEVLSHNLGTVSTNDPADGSYGRAFADASRTFEDVQIINVKNNASNNETNIYLNGRKIDNVTGTTTVTGQTLNFAGFLNKPYYLGVGRYTLNGEPFESHLNGQLTEVFSFASRLGDAPQQKIYSYLAIKNGVSLHNPSSTLDDHRADWDYLDSDNGIIWNATANTTFNYDVAAIGRDDNSQFVQKQSKSENSTSIIAIGLNRVEDLGSQNTANFLDDKDFLFWGHNGANLSQNPTPLTFNLGTTDNVTVTMNHINRVWKIQDRVTTDMPTVQLRVATSDLAGLGTLDADERYVLIVADDSALSTNVETSVFSNDGASMR
ncbi:MAG: choice-of-anchor D domain-containing protein, partial [Nonlabens sp.]|nr:choice-of-anchor D domain-containing protein [Nonlabens sp.]